MTKQEFLDGLRRSLSGGLETAEVNEHIRYYTEYIDSQLRMGISEETVMATLGEPRLIAKTLLGMEEVESVSEEYVEEDTGNSNERYINLGGKIIKLPGWLFTILVCVVVFLVLTIVFAVLTQLVPFILMAIFMISCIRFLKNLFR
ncbi:MAG: DUF1700 domain-containing protein [Lachnospiraceae bacterium]|nr:DUF1700 domain-containing protein [Lachnospiraceae bacterium]